MPEARVNGVRIWYQETGVGEPVIQIHGAGFGHFITSDGRHAIDMIQTILQDSNRVDIFKLLVATRT
jgi:hypothetical protein